MKRGGENQPEKNGPCWFSDDLLGAPNAVIYARNEIKGNLPPLGDEKRGPFEGPGGGDILWKFGQLWILTLLTRRMDSARSATRCSFLARQW